MNKTLLTGKHVLITGASTGIGNASARLMAARGANVTLIARSSDKLARSVADIKAAGGNAQYFTADVAVREQLLSAIDQAEASFGPVDGLFGNAGTGGLFTPLIDYPDDAFEDILAVNLKSQFWAMKRVLPRMIERRAGAILLTGSLASMRGMAMTVGYNMTKHAVLGLVRSAASEVAMHNVRVNCLIPGLIETPMLTNIAGDDVAAGLQAIGRLSPQGRVGTADETAEVAAFLLSDAASYVNGQAWAVDGGILGTMATGG